MTPQSPVNPEFYDQPDLRAVLAEHNIGALYRALKESGVSQRRIAVLTGQSQSEVSEILKGRKVIAYDLLARIADGLSIPREFMGLSYGDDSTYRGDVTDADPEGDDDMLRRHVLALGGAAITGTAVTKLGELLAELPGPPPVPIPGHLSHTQVRQVQDLTRRLAEAGNGTVCAPDMLSGAAAWAERLLGAAGPDPVKRALMVAVAELHIEAGWAASTELLYRRAMHHYAQALDLATETGDAYLQAIALRYAGMTSAEHGEPDYGLKLEQCAAVATWKIPANEQRAVVVGETGRAAVEATGLGNTATVLSLLGDHDTAATWLLKGRDLWTPNPADPFGDLDRPAAEVEIRRGRLDVAEHLATASVDRWRHGSPISRTLSRIVLATVHVRAGEPDGPRLAHEAITSVATLNSARPRCRKRLEPLATALDQRREPAARDLARQARQVATA